MGCCAEPTNLHATLHYGRQMERLWQKATNNDLVLFSLSASFAITLGLALYRLAVGSMTEPSELGGAIAVAKGIVLCTVTKFQFALTCP